LTWSEEDMRCNGQVVIVTMVWASLELVRARLLPSDRMAVDRQPMSDT